MKLFILPVLLSATTALASPIVGTWHCVGNTYIAQSDIQIEYFLDGSFKGDGTVNVDIDDYGNNLLTYHLISAGQWRFENDVLTRRQIKVSDLSRHHSPETQAWLEKSEDARSVENMIHSILGGMIGVNNEDDVQQLDRTGKLVSGEDGYRKICTKVK
jgi:hypothetical protein